jgi:putative membrane protein
MVLDEPALERLAQAVAEAERHTAGEIVVVAVGRSDPWTVQRAALAFAVAALCTVAAAALAPAVGAGWWAAIFAALFAVSFALSGVPALLRLLLRDDEVDAVVLREAKVAFVDHGVHRTADRAGVIVYLSLLEHRVQILADAGVHRVVGEEGWRSWVERVTGAMRASSVDELVKVVEELGGILAKAFPPRAENPDELPNVIHRA